MSSNPVAPFRNSQSAGRPLWCLSAGQALRHREWQGEYVLYNDISGDTHLVDEAAMHLLWRLQATPADASALVGLLSAEAGTDEAGGDAATLLSQLEALALIEQVA